jgi:N-methylhydantoinase A
LLGYVPHDYFLGGTITLQPDLARDALARLGERLDLDAVQTAHAVFTTVNSFMADQILEISTKRGHDVRDFTLIGAGGAGAVHAASIARLVGIPTILIPRFSALFSAFGMFAMPIGRSYVRSYLRRLAAAELDTVNRLFAEMEVEGRQAFTPLHVPAQAVELRRTVDLRYIGQFHEIEVPVARYPLTPEDLVQAEADFHRRHYELYGFTQPRRGLEILGCRTTTTVANPPVEIPAAATREADPAPALWRHRPCFLDGRFFETPCYLGERLVAGNVLSGPAIVEETTTTVVVPDGFTCTVDPYRNYLLRQQDLPAHSPCEA